jgi:hypothetical protein
MDVTEVGQTSASGGPPGVVLQVNCGAGGGVGAVFGDVGLGLGDDPDVRDGEACDVGEMVGAPVVLGPHAVAIVSSATSHTTDLRRSLEHSLREKTVQRR